MSTATTIALGLDYLCFECPRCRCWDRLVIEYYRGDIKIACGLCRMRFRSWFNGQMWLVEFVEYVWSEAHDE